MDANADSHAAGYLLLRRGKVRDIYSLGDDRHLMIITTDRISAFDHVLPTPIPGKGIMLTRMSNFWFSKTAHIIANHLVDTNPEWLDWDWGDERCYDELRGRVVVVKKAQPLRIEAIVRGYLSGSAWKEFWKTGRVCGNLLPLDLRESEKLPSPIYTPSTKAEGGAHDVNISFDDTVAILGNEIAARVRELSLALYTFCAEYAEDRGIVIADTKLEFGLVNDELILIDELFTPDSSRFWPLEGFTPGGPQPSFDKQYVRDYLESTGWDKNPPAPYLPEAIVNETTARYGEALTCLGADQGPEGPPMEHGSLKTPVYR